MELANGVVTEVSLDELAQDVSHYLQMIESGEGLLLTKLGKPIAEVKPIAFVTTTQRPFGLCAGEFVVPETLMTPCLKKLSQVLRADEAST